MDIKEIEIIPSKSFAHRALICDFLAGGTGDDVVCSLDSDDIKATRECLSRLKDGDHEIDAHESGSTLRFILPLTGVLGRAVSIHTSGRLSERPMGPFEDELAAHGMDISHYEDGTVRVSGRLSPGVFRLPGSISSQFITGLLLSLPALDRDSRIELTSGLKSSAYVDMTMSVLADFGITVNEHDGIYEVPGRQTYHTDHRYQVEGDWSQAAFWLVMGLIGNDPVCVKRLRPDSVQGDRMIVNVLRSMNGRIEEETYDGQARFTAYPSHLTGTDVNVSEIPDLAPAVAAAGACAAGVTRLTDAERLRFKESDRIQSIVNCLKSLGSDASEGDDEIVVNGKGCPLTGGKAETYADHRIVMMAAVLSLVCSSPVAISESGAVSKSYPQFFDEMEKEGLSWNLTAE